MKEKEKEKIQRTMDSDGKTILPQANGSQEGNAVVDSDRVKTSVVGAGSGCPDCGGSQKSLKRVDHLAQDATSEDKKNRASQIDVLAEKRRRQRERLARRHCDTLDELSKFLVGKSNVHREIRRIVASLFSGWQQVQEMDVKEGGKQWPAPSTVDTKTTLGLMKDKMNIADGSFEGMDIEEIPKARRVSLAKRRREKDEKGIALDAA